MTVLVGVQGPDTSAAAIRAAAQEARLRGTQLVAVTAYSEHAPAAPAGRPAATFRSPDEERASAEESLRAAALGALGPDAAHVSLRVAQGVPGRTLVEAARALEAELLVVPSGGDGALSWLLGSRYVLRNAPCPILIVPDQQTAA